MNDFPENFGKVVKLTREMAAAEQIHGAIRAFRAGEFASAVTLSLAAEGQLPDGDRPHLRSMVRKQDDVVAKKMNAVRDWLKHYNPPDDYYLIEFEVIVCVLRGVT